MRAAYDQFAKQLLGAALAPMGRVESEREVAPDAQRIDIWFVPDLARSRERAAAGLLGRMAREPCLFEAFHQPPDAHAIRSCIRKHFAWHARLEPTANRPAPLPILWILSAGRPGRPMRGFGFTHLDDWPAGVHAAAPELGLRLVVIPDLPTTAETLPLRLLGAGRVLIHAVRELSMLPHGSELRQRAAPLVLQLRFMDTGDPASREREKLMQATEELFQEFQRRTLAQGVAQGVVQGERRALVKLFQLRLDRALTDAEADVVAERAERLGLDRVEQLVLTSSALDTAHWLADSTAT